MQTELTSPACLLLGLAPLDRQICQLGITLQFPQIPLLARRSSALAVSGARADLARQQAEHFFQHHHLPPQAEIEIELAIPQFMGLGSAAMLGLSIARALATLHALPADDLDGLARSVGLADDEALEMHAFAQGALLLVGEQGALLRRHAIAHSDEADDWVLVFVLPRPPAETPASLERDQRATLRAASQLRDSKHHHSGSLAGCRARRYRDIRTGADAHTGTQPCHACSRRPARNAHATGANNPRYHAPCGRADGRPNAGRAGAV